MQRKRRNSSAPAVLKTPEKKKRKKWSDEQMVAAVESVEKGLSCVNQAALQHGVPKSSLKNRLSGRVVHGANQGPRPYLDKSELSEFLQKGSLIGYGKTRKDVLNITEAYASSKEIMRKQNISDG